MVILLLYWNQVYDPVTMIGEFCLRGTNLLYSSIINGLFLHITLKNCSRLLISRAIIYYAFDVFNVCKLQTTSMNNKYLYVFLGWKVWQGCKTYYVLQFALYFEIKWYRFIFVAALPCNYTSGESVVKQVKICSVLWSRLVRDPGNEREKSCPRETGTREGTCVCAHKKKLDAIVQHSYTRDWRKIITFQLKGKTNDR